MQGLLELEKRGWNALATSKDAAIEFYAPLLTDKTIMVFPDGMMLVGKDQILGSIAAQPWETFKIAEPRELTLSEATHVIVYSITAQRTGSKLYKALISSTYTLRGGQWKLALHQQTPA